MKKFLALMLAVLLVASLAACSFSKKVSDSVEKGLENAGVLEESPEPNTGKATFTVIVVYQDGTEKEFSYTTEEAYVGPVLMAEGLLQGNEGPYGLEITHVDGVQAIYDTDKAYWAVYEGDQYAMQGIDTTPVVDGATYKLVYTLA